MRHFILIAALIMAGACATHGTGKLLLKSNFGPAVSIPADISDMKGTDKETGFSWDATPGWIAKSNFVYLSKDPKKYMNSEIVKVKGPKGDSCYALHTVNKGNDPDHSSTSRNEYSFFGRKPPNDYKEGYVRYYLKLDKNLGRIDTRNWYMIMEWKEPNSGKKFTREQCTKGSAGGTNNYRINIGITWVDNSLRWIIAGQHPQPCRVTEWTVTNKKIDVPLGEWFLVEAYMKKHATDGRVWFAVNGVAVIDRKGRTQHPDNPLPLHFWSPMKLYHGKGWYKYGPTNHYYTGFELWSGFPPERKDGADTSATGGAEEPEKKPEPTHLNPAYPRRAGPGTAYNGARAFNYAGRASAHPMQAGGAIVVYEEGPGTAKSLVPQR